MNDINNFLNQQYGKKKWLSYDSCLRRLRCSRSEDFTQIFESALETFPDTPIFACKFAQKRGYEHILALANEEGELAVCDTLMKEDRIGVRAHHNAIFDLAWMYKETKLVTVSGDHTARLLDLTADGLNTVQIFNGHMRSVKTVSFRRNDYWVFSTGSRDGSIMVWDIRTNTPSSTIGPDNKIENSHAIKRTVTPKRKNGTPYVQTCVSGANSVTGMVFQDDNTLISCGAGDGMIKFWDLRKTYNISKREPLPKHVIPYSGSTLRNGFSNLVLDETCIKLYASCLDNSIYCYNIASYNTEPIIKYVGHQNRTYYVKACITRDGRYLLSGSSDHYAYIWNVSNPNPVAKLKGHMAEVTCVDWCSTNLTVVTCSDDMTHKFWRLGPEYVPDNWEVIGAGECIPLTQPKLKKRKITTVERSPKKKKACDKCSDSTEAFCENCNYNPKARKRLQMDNPDGNVAKKRNIEKFATIVEEDVQENDQKEIHGTPRTSNLLTSLENISSPTSNLPNFVVDGCAPHLNFSPKKRVDPDWLTKMRTEKQLRKRMKEVSADEPVSPNKIPKLDGTPKSSHKPRRRLTESPKSPLLRYFKITNSSNSTSQCSQMNNKSVSNVHKSYEAL